MPRIAKTCIQTAGRRILRSMLPGVLFMPLLVHASLVGPSDSAWPADFNLGSVVAPGAYTFGHTVAQSQPWHPDQPGFSDYWRFTVRQSATANGWVASLGMAGYLDVEGLKIRLVEWTGAGAGAVVEDWVVATTTDIGGNPYRAAAQVPVSLSSGQSYAVHIQGTAVGGAGGSYSAGMNLVPAPVPLPGALGLLIAGLSVLGAAASRRRFF